MNSGSVLAAPAMLNTASTKFHTIRGPLSWYPGLEWSRLRTGAMFTSIERSCLQCSHVRIYDSGDSYGMQLFEKRCLVRVRNYVIFEANQSDHSTD